MQSLSHGPAPANWLLDMAGTFALAPEHYPLGTEMHSQRLHVSDSPICGKKLMMKRRCVYFIFHFKEYRYQH